jgi:hypothetical protein
MTFVRTLLRWLLTTSLAAACAAQPLALDACRASCDLARSTRIAAAPPCHHAAAGSRIGQPVRPCGQDHAVVPADSASSVPAPTVVVAASTRASIFEVVTPRVRVAESSADPPAIPLSLASSTPLRV